MKHTNTRYAYIFHCVIVLLNSRPSTPIESERHKPGQTSVGMCTLVLKESLCTGMASRDSGSHPKWSRYPKWHLGFLVRREHKLIPFRSLWILHLLLKARNWYPNLVIAWFFLEDLECWGSQSKVGGWGGETVFDLGYRWSLWAEWTDPSVRPYSEIAW